MNTRQIQERRMQLESELQQAEELSQIEQRTSLQNLEAARLKFKNERDTLIRECSKAGNHEGRHMQGCNHCGWKGSPA